MKLGAQVKSVGLNDKSVYISLIFSLDFQRVKQLCLPQGVSANWTLPLTSTFWKSCVLEPGGQS